jgi:hypothetical protein
MNWSTSKGQVYNTPAIAEAYSAPYGALSIGLVTEGPNNIKTYSDPHPTYYFKPHEHFPKKLDQNPATNQSRNSVESINTSSIAQEPPLPEPTIEYSLLTNNGQKPDNIITKLNLKDWDLDSLINATADYNKTSPARPQRKLINDQGITILPKTNVFDKLTPVNPGRIGGINNYDFLKDFIREESNATAKKENLYNMDLINKVCEQIENNNYDSELNNIAKIQENMRNRIMSAKTVSRYNPATLVKKHYDWHTRKWQPHAEEGKIDTFGRPQSAAMGR